MFRKVMGHRTRRAMCLLLLATGLCGSLPDDLSGCGGRGPGGTVGLGRRGRNNRARAPGAAAPAAPATQTSGLFPGAETPPPAGEGNRPQQIAAAPQSVEELASVYGIELRGAVTDDDVKNVMAFAGQYLPEETNGLKITFIDPSERINSGVLGVWSSSGNCQIYSNMPDVVFHEGTHHITRFGRNSRSRQIADQVYTASAIFGGGAPDDSTITRSYARTKPAEFMAEFFTGLAALERGVRLQFTIRSNGFNPPEEIRALARTIYANRSA